MVQGRRFFARLFGVVLALLSVLTGVVSVSPTEAASAAPAGVVAPTIDRLTPMFALGKPMEPTASSGYTECFMPHACPWPRRTIWIENHARSIWQIQLTPAIWRLGTGLHINYGTCHAGYPCIKVYSGNYGSGMPRSRDFPNGLNCGTSWVGCTGWWFKNSRLSTVNIFMNDRFSWYPWSQRVQTACHEMGHALGLWKAWEYTVRDDSCMYYIATGNNRWPNAYDQATLDRMYRNIGW